MAKPSCTFITVGKRALEQPKMPPIKRVINEEERIVPIPPVALPQMQPSSLLRVPCQLDKLLNYVPKVTSKYGGLLEETILGLLMEQYSIEATIVDMSRQGDHSTILKFKGVCPLHRLEHHSNHWCLINTKTFNTTLFLCHHDGSRRIITHKLPF